MNFRSLPTGFVRFFRKKDKEYLVAGILLLVAAIVSTLPGALHLIDGLGTMGFSLFYINEYVSIVIFSLAIMLPFLILLCITYLLWEGHSLGWKLSIVTCGVALILFATNSGFIYFALPITVLSALAAMIEFQTIQTHKINQREAKDSPIVTENVVKLGLRLSAAISIGIVVALIIFVIVMASPFISLQLFTSMNINLTNVNRICQGLAPNGSAGGFMGYALGTLLLVVFCEFFAVPIGVGAAIYLAEYSKQGRIVGTLRFFIEVLAGSPSIVIAIIGITLFVETLNWGYSLWSAALALSFMALPWNIRVAEGSLKSVPKSYREASFALGATQWQTARLVTLYAALPGIITGILLGIGVAIGETLVLLFTYTGEGTSSFPTVWWHVFNFHTQLPSLTVFIYNAVGTNAKILEGNILSGGNLTHQSFYVWSVAFAAALVLIIIYLIMCIGALLLRNYLNKRMRGS